MINRLRELERAATPGPWAHGAVNGVFVADTELAWIEPPEDPESDINAALIVALRNLAPELLDVVDAARKREAAEEALADVPSSAPELPRLETERAEAVLAVRKTLAALDAKQANRG